VAENPSAVVSPVIDIISDESFAYVRSFDLHWGAFNWQLHFRWFAVSEAEIKLRWKNQAKPFR
jgi:polypeptide N-acetylgalactosaminyltransferase